MSATSPHIPPQGRSLTRLLSDLWHETFNLLRAETELAKAEMREKVSRVETGLGALATGGAVAFAGFLVLLWAAVAALAEAMPERPAWMAPLIVGAVVLLIGLLMLAKGRNNLKHNTLAPTRTANSLRRDGALAREHLR